MNRNQRFWLWVIAVLLLIGLVVGIWFGFIHHGYFFTREKELKAAWIQAIPTLIVGFVAAYAAILAARISIDLKRQIALKVAEKRLDAYAGLWSVTEAFGSDKPPLDQKARANLAQRMTRWYYDGGNGMLLTSVTLQLFRKIRVNLTAAPGRFEPETWRPLISDGTDERRALLIWRQCSLLRTQLKIDCRVYDDSISPDPCYLPYDLDFLGEAYLDPLWKRAEPKNCDEGSYLVALRTARGQVGQAAAVSYRVATSVLIAYVVARRLGRTPAHMPTGAVGSKATGSHRRSNAAPPC